MQNKYYVCIWKRSCLIEWWEWLQVSLTSAHHLDPPLMLTHTHTHTKAQQREVWPGQSVGTELSQKRNNFGRKRKENSKNGGNFRPVASSRRIALFSLFLSCALSISFYWEDWQGVDKREQEGFEKKEECSLSPCCTFSHKILSIYSCRCCD